ncbi:MAG: L-rhamnose/proton symporter RhaT [Bryobacteraceae bacterium]
MITPNLTLGIGFHAVGAMLSANCYSPQKYVRRWAWETFWIAQAAWCWLLWPIIGALATIPNLPAVLAEAPKDCMLASFLMGVAYGVGGTAFNVSIRYIGFSLTYAIAVGLSSVLGTLIPPLAHGQLGSVLSNAGSEWLIAGIATGALGIALCGVAGRWKEIDLARGGTTGEFSLRKGFTLSLVAGLLSAVYGFALDVAAPIADIAEKHGAGIWKGNVSYLFANTGAFLTALLYCLYLGRRNRTSGELGHLAGGDQPARLWINHLLAILTGTLWYGQFFFYNLGHVRLAGKYAFSSWAIHMIMLVLFSNLVAMMFLEWKGCRRRTQGGIAVALGVLCTAVVLLTYGNYLGAR